MPEISRRRQPMGAIEWAAKAPKPVRKKQQGFPRAYADFRDALLKRPGRWGKWPVPMTAKAAYDVAYCINTDRRPTFPSKQFEGREEDGVLWVRARPPKRKAKR